MVSDNVFKMIGGDDFTQWFQSQAADFYYTGYKSWSHGMTTVAILEVNVLKNS